MIKKIKMFLYSNSNLYLFLREIIKPIVEYISRSLFRFKWKIHNRHNHTEAVNIFPIEVVSVGKRTYGRLRVLYFKTPKEKLTIGSHCSIGGDVTFLLGGNHPMNLFSTYPFASHFHRPDFAVEDKSTKGPITIEADVWIGHGSIILSGVTIGQGAVIGAGSVVSKDVPPYAIFLGNSIAKFRFNQEIIDELIKIDFEKISDTQFMRLESLMYKPMTKDLAKEIVESIDADS